MIYLFRDYIEIPLVGLLHTTGRRFLICKNIKNAIKEAISKEDIDEKYIRDFLNCSIIDRNSKEINLDKIMFIYKYGSKKAKQIAVDEKLKMM